MTTLKEVNCAADSFASHAFSLVVRQCEVSLTNSPGQDTIPVLRCWRSLLLVIPIINIQLQLCHQLWEEIRTFLYKCVGPERLAWDSSRVDQWNGCEMQVQWVDSRTPRGRGDPCRSPGAPYTMSYSGAAFSNTCSRSTLPQCYYYVLFQLSSALGRGRLGFLSRGLAPANAMAAGLLRWQTVFGIGSVVCASPPLWPKDGCRALG